jgi:hypothetical protein
VEKDIEISGKKIRISVSPNAVSALTQRQSPLVAEMELYFSCLIRKKVRFYEPEYEPEHEQEYESEHEQEVGVRGTSVLDNLSVVFHPVMTKLCGKDYEGDEPPVTDFPIVKAAPFVPHWMTIDYKAGQWLGEFGYTESP